LGFFGVVKPHTVTSQDMKDELLRQVWRNAFCENEYLRTAGTGDMPGAAVPHQHSDPGGMPGFAKAYKQ
jgi:hypothetical protein